MDKSPIDIWSQTAAQFQETVSQSWAKALSNFQSLDLGTAMAAVGEPVAPPHIEFSADKLQAVQQQYLQEAGALMANWSAAEAPAVADKRFNAPAWQHNPVAAMAAAVALVRN